MEKELKNYKVATWVFAIIAVILAVLLIMTNNKEASSGLEEATATLRKCSDDLATWRAANPSAVTASPEAQEELSDILKACSGNTGDSADEESVLPQ